MLVYSIIKLTLVAYNELKYAHTFLCVYTYCIVCEKTKLIYYEKMPYLYGFSNNIEHRLKYTNTQRWN